MGKRGSRQAAIPTQAGRKGHFFHEYWVDCGYCSEAAPLATWRSEENAAEARRLGWHHTADIGWVCPHCWVERKRAKAEGRPHNYART